MREKDDGEKLLDLLVGIGDLLGILDMETESRYVLSGRLGQAYQLAGKVVYELDELKERVAELGRQAAIGRRAVEMLGDLEWSGGPSGWPACPYCGWEIGPNGHAVGCKLVAILRDAATAPHSDDLAVDRFAVAMKAKLAAARAKGRGGWDDPEQCSVEFLANLLIGHVRKGNAGNFEDIANLAMMLHQRGADPAVLEQAAQEPATVAANPTQWFEPDNRRVTLSDRTYQMAPTLAVDAGALEALRDIVEWFDAGDVEAARECAVRARRLLAGGE